MDTDNTPQEKTKTCKSCKEEILSTAKICKYCKAKQGNWFVRNKFFTGVFIVIVLLILAGGAKNKKNGLAPYSGFDIGETTADEVVGIQDGGGTGISEEISLAQRSSLPENKDIEVKKITNITDDGGRLDWSPVHNLIVFDQLRSEDEYFDIFTMNISGGNKKCLTCDHPDLPNRHIGQPEWHPSGKYIVMQVQKDFMGLFGKVSEWFANPGAGINNDVWIMNYETNRVYQISDVPKSQGGVLHPHFSKDGKKIFWAERHTSKGGDVGYWHIKIGDFSEKDGVPIVSNIKRIEPAGVPTYYETHSFSPNGKEILFTSNPKPGQAFEAADIYKYNLETGLLTDLTDSTEYWDEHAHFSPDGSKIIWMSSKDIKDTSAGNPIEKVPTDYWIMDADGSNKKRLTYFNDPSHQHYWGREVVAADFVWLPDGNGIIAYVIVSFFQAKASNILIEF